MVGQPFSITVTFDLTVETDQPLGDELVDHVGALPGTGLVLADEIPITLHRIDDGVYGGEVTFPSAGLWRIWTQPHISHRHSVMADHTNFVEIEVLSEAPRNGLPTVVLVVAAAAVLGLIIATGTRRRESTTGGPQV